MNSTSIGTNWNKPLILSIVIILIVTLTPGNGKFAGNYLDKVAHFLIFFNLGIQISSCFKNRTNLIFAIMAGIAFGVLTEVIQQFIPGRNFEVLDILADSLGVILGVLLYRKNNNWFSKITSHRKA